MAETGAPASPGRASDGRRRDLARLRHDLRTPIGAVVGYAEMLLEDADDLPPAVVTDLGRVLRAGRDLLELVNRSFEADRFEAALRADPLGFEAQLRYALRTPVATVVGYAELLAEDAADLPPAVTGDLARIASAGRTLLDLVEGQDGLSSALEAPSGDRPAAPENAPAAPSGRGERILAVDDVAANRDLLARRLVREGYEVALADSGEAALARLADDPCDLVLLDVMMPGIGGVATLARLKADPATAHLPVIMISSLDEAADVARCLDLGADDFLPKPFDPVVLRARVGSSLERKRLRDAELAYRRAVTTLTDAAAEVEAGTFRADPLADVAARDDDLGRLARVFVRMAGEVQARQARLEAQVRDLRIEIDEAKKQKAVDEISETDYFRTLQARAQKLRRRGGLRAAPSDEPPEP